MPAVDVAVAVAAAEAVAPAAASATPAAPSAAAAANQAVNGTRAVAVTRDRVVRHLENSDRDVTHVERIVLCVGHKGDGQKETAGG